MDAATVRYLNEAIVLESQRYSVATLHHGGAPQSPSISAADTAMLDVRGSIAG